MAARLFRIPGDTRFSFPLRASAETIRHATIAPHRRYRCHDLDFVAACPSIPLKAAPPLLRNASRVLGPAAGLLLCGAAGHWRPERKACGWWQGPASHHRPWMIDAKRRVANPSKPPIPGDDQSAGVFPGSIEIETWYMPGGLKPEEPSHVTKGNAGA